MQMLARGGEVSVSDLAAHFAVTHMTIRRDLELLEAQDLVVRTHGGALMSRPAVVEFAFTERSRTNLAQKRAIGLHCASYVKPGMRLIMDTGTTTLEVARAISGLRNITVLTSSLPIAAALYHVDDINVILLGGTVRKSEPNLSGPLTEDNLKRFHADLAILGADALCTAGAYTTDLEVANVSRCMIEAAAESILVADSEKFRRDSFVKFAEWQEISRLITDPAITPEDRQNLESIAVNYDIAEAASPNTDHFVAFLEDGVPERTQETQTG